MRAFALLFFLAAASAQAALTLVQRETFQAVGTLDSGTPGNLGTVTGNFYKRAVGPRLTSDTTANSLGWSADMRVTAQTNHDVYHVISIVGTAAEWKGTYSAFYYFDTFSNTGATTQSLGSVREGNGNILVGALMDSSTGNFRYASHGGTTGDSGVAVPLKTWIELRLSWENLSAASFGNYNVEIAYRVAGTSSWVSIYSRSNFGTGSNPGTAVRGGAVNGNASSGVFNGRYGMPSIYALGSYSDRTTLVSDVTDPTDAAVTWYVNPVTGSDTNDGTDAAHAWQTVAKINAESLYCGMFPATSYASGDTLTINTSGGNLVLGTSSLNVNTRGLNLVQTGNGEIQAWVALSNAGFALTADTTKVYQIALSEANASCVVWEDDKWLNHITGANIAAAKASLESTAGSFWTDGTTMYVHPFGNTNPTSDGKVYTRSYNRGGLGVSAVQLLVPDVHVNGLRVRKTCLADKSTNDPILGYNLQAQSGFGGTSLIENCYLDYGAKHMLGITDNNSGGRVTIYNVQVEQGSPYASQTPFVSYNGGASDLDNRHTYSYCTNNKTSGLIGSTAGRNELQDSLYSHNTDGNGQFSQINVDHCTFGGSIGGYAVTTMTINDSQFAGGYLGADEKVINRCRVTADSIYNGKMLQNTGSGQTLTARNCIILPTIQWGGGLNNTHDLNGTVTMEANTIDLTGVLNNPSSNGGGVFKHASNATLTFRNNVVILPGTNAYSVFENLTTGDTVTATNNAYVAAGAVIAKAYNDGSTTADRSFAQWQALNKDANSVNTSDMKLAATYRPLRSSPAVNAGVDLGPLVDYSGRLVQVRNDIGAYELLRTVGYGHSEGYVAR